MAVRAFGIDYRDRGAAVITWTGLEDGDTGTPFSLIQFADKMIQVTGTFGSGGEVTVEGSSTDSDWETLTDYDGNPIVITDETQWLIKENPVNIRVNVTGGDGDTELVATVTAT